MIEPDPTTMIEHPVILQPWVHELAEILEEARIVNANTFLLAAQRVLERHDRQRREVKRWERANRKRQWWKRLRNA